MAQVSGVRFRKPVKMWVGWLVMRCLAPCLLFHRGFPLICSHRDRLGEPAAAQALSSSTSQRMAPPSRRGRGHRPAAFIRRHERSDSPNAAAATFASTAMAEAKVTRLHRPPSRPRARVMQRRSTTVLPAAGGTQRHDAGRGHQTAAHPDRGQGGTPAPSHRRRRCGPTSPGSADISGPGYSPLDRAGPGSSVGTPFLFTRARAFTTSIWDLPTVGVARPAGAFGGDAIRGIPPAWPFSPICVGLFAAGSIMTVTSFPVHSK
jgi:hypothetical protein